YVVLVFFFFQAEDGIRDSSVTGVQTCALPISLARDSSPPMLITMPEASTPTPSPAQSTATRFSGPSSPSPSLWRLPRRFPRAWRSEERRVGKEWDYRLADVM